jgi:hypothetical protein
MGLVRGWFVRLVVMVAILAVVAFDGLSIMVAHFQVSDAANQAAQAAAVAYRQSNDTATGPGVLAAEQSLPHGDELVPGSVQFLPDGSVTLQVRQTAKSLLLHVFKQTRSWALVTESGSANPPQ